ncbi:LOW QUALITY PROTEIN: hypothetical protein TorRG33x02_199280 [Trema orientale]|uniref:Uncharacterized protein n=1 Tax=Trema orientale TaxID=63057 RepID=A0A2P5EFJ6_TREOI|nr:LOW QUALITY PROTEIN: hypothetical protein TorRG33x02_199280 [Trema orientale]
MGLAMGLTLESAGSESELDSASDSDPEDESGALEGLLFSAAGAGDDRGVVLSFSSSDEEEEEASSSSSDEEAAGGSSKWEERFGAMDGDPIRGFQI